MLLTLKYSRAFGLFRAPIARICCVFIQIIIRHICWIDFTVISQFTKITLNVYLSGFDLLSFLTVKTPFFLSVTTSYWFKSNNIIIIVVQEKITTKKFPLQLSTRVESRSIFLKIYPFTVVKNYINNFLETKWIYVTDSRFQTFLRAHTSIFLNIIKKKKKRFNLKMFLEWWLRPWKRTLTSIPSRIWPHYISLLLYLKIVLRTATVVHSEASLSNR